MRTYLRGCAQASQNGLREAFGGPVSGARQVDMSNRGAGVAGGVRCGLGLAARRSSKACGAGGAGPSIGWRSDHAESLASGGCERCAGLEEKEGGVLARDAWAAGGRFGGGWAGCGAVIG